MYRTFISYITKTKWSNNWILWLYFHYFIISLFIILSMSSCKYTHQATFKWMLKHPKRHHRPVWRNNSFTDTKPKGRKPPDLNYRDICRAIPNQFFFLVHKTHTEMTSHKLSLSNVMQTKVMSECLQNLKAFWHCVRTH